MTRTILTLALCALVSPLEAQLPVNFDGGLPAGWTASGLWHVSNSCSVPGDCGDVSWAYFGDDDTCNFQLPTTSYGTLRSPEILITDSTLTYCSAFDGESGGYDQATVELDVTVDGPLENGPDWAERTVDLSAYAGQSVRIIFFFDTVDAASNGALGWQVDDIELTENGTNALISLTDFEGGLPFNWHASGLWHVTDACAGSSPSCNGGSLFAYYGLDLDCSFDTGSAHAGALESGFMTIPPAGATLTYCSAFEGQDVNGLDIATVKIATLVDGPMSALPGGPAWETRQVDLGDFVDQTVQLAFRFDSVDGIANLTLGWQVDAIGIGSVADSFLRGDANGDGSFNGLTDALWILAHQFQGGPPPPCLESADANGDSQFNGLTDGLWVLNHQFQSGPPPGTPYPACGVDPDPDTSLGCDTPPSCP